MPRASSALPLALAVALALPALAAPVAAPSREEADAVLQRWVAAQNQGNFQDYLALYAKTFRSVPHGGGAALDLVRWSRAREKMFHQPLQVKVNEGIEAKTRRNGMALTFTLDWTSGAERGIARKTITVARVEDHPAIVAETLLCSLTQERKGTPVLHVRAADESEAALVHPGVAFDRLPDEDDRACSPVTSDVWSVQVTSRRSLTTSRGRLDAFTFRELQAPEAGTYVEQWNGGGLGVTRDGERIALEEAANCDIERFYAAKDDAVLTVSCGVSYHASTQVDLTVYRVGASGVQTVATLPTQRSDEMSSAAYEATVEYVDTDGNGVEDVVLTVKKRRKVDGLGEDLPRGRKVIAF